MLFVFHFSIIAQNDCLIDFDYIINKIKEDYPGYNDKVNEKNLPELKALETKIREKIKQYPDNCSKYLNEYCDFFEDYHLGVGKNRENNKNINEKREILEISSYGKNININEDSLYNATKNNKGIEGIWKNIGDELAIFKNGENIIASVITKKNNTWKRGQIIYEITPLTETTFEFKEHTLIKNGKISKVEVSIHSEGNILEIHDDTRFVRKTRDSISNIAALYSYSAKFPNGSNTYPVAMPLDDSTYYIRVPSFYSDYSNNWIESHLEEITKRPYLIIDIRNNGGGQDNYYDWLAKLIYTNPFKSDGVEWYASKGNIQYFEDIIKNKKYKKNLEDENDWEKWTSDLVEEMKKNVGGFVVHPHYVGNDIISRDTIFIFPRKVGIIINEENGSSAEQFLLEAKESKKVILFGNQNTAGVLDYSNKTPTITPSGKYDLWCPMTRSTRLPDYPIDNIGIAPDVIIPFEPTLQLYNRLDDWVYFVYYYLQFSK